MVEPPSLPYARDEASTSQHAFAHPSYIDTFENEEEDAEGSVEEDANTAPQYWAAKRHKSGKGKGKSEEEHSMSPREQCKRASEPELTTASGMETEIKAKDFQLRHVHLPEYRCGSARYRQDKSLRKVRMLARSDSSPVDKSNRRYWPE